MLFEKKGMINMKLHYNDVDYYAYIYPQGRGKRGRIELKPHDHFYCYREAMKRARVWASKETQAVKYTVYCGGHYDKEYIDGAD